MLLRLPVFRPLVLATLLVSSTLRSVVRLVDDAFLTEEVDGENGIIRPLQQPNGGRHQRRPLTEQTNESNIGPASFASSPLSSEIVVDIISVGSVSRLALLDVQRRTMGSHVSVRNFFNATELDDADPECYQKLTWEHVQKISRFCTRETPAKSSVYRYMTSVMFAKEPWLKKKPNAIGWMCGQKRPYYGLVKAANHYKIRRKEGLPDWLIIADDDTYYNMEVFHESFRRRNASDFDVSVGCLIRLPAHTVRFSFPYGGFGSVVSRGSLEKLVRPIECPSSDDQAICDRLQENIVGELRYFRNGMSLIDLIHAYVSTERYRDVDRWSTGFCMHSDWVLGYFVNFYNVSRHVEDPDDELVPQARIEPFVKGSEYHYRQRRGLCKNEGACRQGDAVCHKAPVSWIEQETDRLRHLLPHRFRNAP